MQEATKQTVLAPFDGSTFSEGNRTYTFFRKNGEHRVRVTTEGSTPERTYRVPYTFGVEPLQQYLLDFPGGRLQALTVAWDRQRNEWFSLYPGQTFKTSSWLHWTGQSQNWNASCASCHSTGFRKNYDRQRDVYDSTWTEIDVSCESCHGPGAQHVRWARNRSSEPSGEESGTKNHDDYGLATRYTASDTVRWQTGPDGVPERVNPDREVPDTQLTECGRCHGRRSRISTQYRHGKNYLDHFMPTLIEEGMYFPDGQIKEEVYVYGSFRQSKMYENGVRCTDCHDPHSGELKLSGNDLCTRCHGAEQYDTPEHHHHPTDTAGADCVSCHMPDRTYMQIDDRRDHSFQVPRPDLTKKIGTPNACTGCHTDRSADWAAGRIDQWTGGTERRPGIAPTFELAWQGTPSAAQELRSLLRNPDHPAFIRASAARNLSRFPSRATFDAARETLGADDPLLRRAAVQLVSRDRRNRSPDDLTSLLDDPVRGVRHAAARALSTMDGAGLSQKEQKIVRRNVDQIKNVLLQNSDTRGGQLGLGHFYRQRGETKKAIHAFRKAIEIDPKYVDARTSLARLYARQDQQQKAASVLEPVTEQSRPPAMSERIWNRALGDVYYQLGLLYAGPLNKTSRARRYLEKARRLAPERARIHYNLGLLYSQIDRLEEAEQALNRARELQPDNSRYLYALVTVHRDHGRLEKALEYAKQLKEAFPNRRRFRRIHRMLKRRAR